MRGGNLSTGGHERNRQGTKGHDIRPVRDREAPGSNPGPPTNFVFEIGDFSGRLESAEISRITISAEQWNRGGVTVPFARQCEIARLESLTRQRSKSADAQGRTVRHRKSQSRRLRWPTLLRRFRRGH